MEFGAGNDDCRDYTGGYFINAEEASGMPPNLGFSWIPEQPLERDSSQLGATAK